MCMVQWWEAGPGDSTTGDSRRLTQRQPDTATETHSRCDGLTDSGRPLATYCSPQEKLAARLRSTIPSFSVRCCSWFSFQSNKHKDFYPPALAVISPSYFHFSMSLSLFVWRFDTPPPSAKPPPRPLCLPQAQLPKIRQAVEGPWGLDFSVCVNSSCLLQYLPNWIQPLGSVYLIFSQLWGVRLATAYKSQAAWPTNPAPNTLAYTHIPFLRHKVYA